MGDFMCSHVGLPVVGREQGYLIQSRTMGHVVTTAATAATRADRNVTIPHDTVLYRRRHKIENMFGRLRDWRRIDTAMTAAPTPSCPAICIAAAVIFWF
jgi:transposase